jgi:transposase
MVRRSVSGVSRAVDQRLVTTWEGLVGKRRALTRGDERRNARLVELRGLVRRDLAVLGVDLASGKQAAVVTDHDSKVLGRRMFFGGAWVIDEILGWAAPIAAKAGFTGVVLGCEPTGHRWKTLAERAGARGVPMVCVNPMLVHRGREEEDFTRDKSDFKDATVIAKKVTELRCYRPYVPEAQWALLRQRGARRAEKVVAAGAARQRLRDLLECAWPAVLAAAAKPLDSATWLAAMTVTCDPAVIVAMGFDAFAEAVRVQLRADGGQRRDLRILRAVYQAALAPGGVEGQRAALCERAGDVLRDWRTARAEIAEVEARMVAVLDTLDLTRLVTTVPGLSAVGAAAILAELGDPARFDSPRQWVKHAGLCPRANESGTFQGATTLSRRGRPGLRTAAWRAVWGALPHNPVLAARYTHLTSRPDNPLRPGQAQAAVAGSLLRQLAVVVTRRVPWDPQIAAGTHPATGTGVVTNAA